MKKLTLISAMLLSAAYCFSQGTAINATGAKADTSAILDLSSTTKGMLVPRMSKANKLAISSPANGLLIYQTDDTTGFWYYNSVKWVQAIGPAGSSGGGSVGGGEFTYISASQGAKTWTNCFTSCLSLSAAPASPVSATVYSDWRMPATFEIFFYCKNFTAPAGGWSGRTWANVMSNSNPGFEDVDETSGGMNWTNDYNTRNCRCVR